MEIEETLEVELGDHNTMYTCTVDFDGTENSADYEDSCSQTILITRKNPDVRLEPRPY